MAGRERSQVMVGIYGHNIYTGVGFGSREVYDLYLKGESGLCGRSGLSGCPIEFYSSLLDRGEVLERFGSDCAANEYTLLEKAMILSAGSALEMSGVNASSDRVLFVISSTKGNVELLENDPSGRDERLPIWRTALKVAGFFGNRNRPLCVTNACTSGVCAQIAAQRSIENGDCDYAVVVGGDIISKFVVSGFNSLKALSPEHCRPFDKSRRGLNLSDAVATIVFGREKGGIGVALESGIIRNDANHISAPSRTAEGQVAAIEALLAGTGREGISFVNVHGTATMYNDNMESVALHRCALDPLPVVSCKGFFGHTLGAAGVVETIISSLALLDGKIMATFGYEENGVDYELDISDKTRDGCGFRFMKMMSGFGGINAAAMYRRTI